MILLAEGKLYRTPETPISESASTLGHLGGNPDPARRLLRAKDEP
jgi:hypothetical protein